MKKTEVFYIEDDESIAVQVKAYFEAGDYKVTLFDTLKAGREALYLHTPDIVLLDYNMPDGRGDVLCRFIREKWSKLPVIFLTVKGETTDMVKGFENGADDYVVKPFELEVLASRIGAVLRRTGNNFSSLLVCDDIQIDSAKMIVMQKGKEVILSQAEYQILLLMMQNKGRTITREQLLEHIWDQKGDYVNDNTLTVTMKRLREKLHQPGCIKTIRSFGYRMEEKQ